MNKMTIMTLPLPIPGLRQLTIVWGIYAVIWIGLEGSMFRVILMGVSTAVLGIGHWIQRQWEKRPFSFIGWLGKTAVLGIVFGGGSAILTLFFMAMKTGLHAHGPEFTPAQLMWIVRQIPVWTISGGIAGLGLGFLTWRIFVPSG